MKIALKEFTSCSINYIIRPATEDDAKSLSEIRVQIDGETENLDRQSGEAYIDEAGFKQLIREDAHQRNHLFLVAEADGTIVGFSRCEGNLLKRTSHKVEFGVGVLKAYWGHGIGTNLLAESIQWADANAIKKIVLAVLETNEKAIDLYSKFGFKVEGTLQKDKLLSDGNYYDTVLMGRWKE